MPVSDTRLDRSAHLRWVRLSDMKVSPMLQREKLDMARVEKIAREFDPDKFDAPSLNYRDGTYWLINGWHRTEGAKMTLGDDQCVQCWVRRDLTDAEAADWSLGLNDYRRWSAMDTFRLEVKAERSDEQDIDRIVRAQGFHISRGKTPGAIRCIGTVKKLYQRGGPKVLVRTLQIIRDAYGDAGLDAAVVDGIGLVCQRYNGQLNNEVAIKRLGDVRGGVNGLMGRARGSHKQGLGQLNHCVAAAAVEIINGGRGGKKLPVWWSSK